MEMLLRQRKRCWMKFSRRWGECKMPVAGMRRADEVKMAVGMFGDIS